MNRWQSWSMTAVTLLLTVSGISLFWMKHLTENDDPFSLISHPWEPAMLYLHILSAPILILLVGMMMNSHILKSLQGYSSGKSRRSGIVTAVTFPLMMMSGYLLQVIHAPEIRDLLLYLHLGSGLLFAGTYVVHLVMRFFPARKNCEPREHARLAA